MSCSCKTTTKTSTTCRTVKNIPGTGECLADSVDYETFQTTDGYVLDIPLYATANGEDTPDLGFTICPMGCTSRKLYISKPGDIIERVEGSNTVYYAVVNTAGILPRDGYYVLTVVVDGVCCGTKAFERNTQCRGPVCFSC